MKGGFQTNEHAARVVKSHAQRDFWGYAHFRSHVTRENPILCQGKSIIDLRRASLGPRPIFF